MSERLSWSEAEAVVRAYRAEQGMASDVDVATLARTLGTSSAEVRRLAGIKRRFIDRSGVLSAGLALLAAIVLLPPALTKRVSPSPLTERPLSATRLPQGKDAVVIDRNTGEIETPLASFGRDDQAPTFQTLPSTDPAQDPLRLDFPEERTL